MDEKDKFIQEINDLYFKIDDVSQEFDRAVINLKSQIGGIIRKIQDVVQEYQISLGLTYD